MASLKRIIERTWLAVFVAAALVFVVFVFKDDRDKLARIADADWRTLGIAALAQIAYYFATVVTWRRVLHVATGIGIGFREGLVQILLVNFGKYIPGKVWGLAARGKRLNELGVSVEDIGRTSYLEQALLLLVGFWLAFLAAALAYDNAIYWIAFIVVTLTILLFRHGDVLVRKIAAVIPRAESLARIFELRIGVGYVLGLSIGYVGVWLFLAMTFMLVCTAFVDVELSAATLPVFVLSLTAGYLAGFLALFAPGGVGVREGVGAAVLATIMTLDDAVLLMLLFRVWIVLAELVAGALVLAVRGGTDGEVADG